MNTLNTLSSVQVDTLDRINMYRAAADNAVKATQAPVISVKLSDANDTVTISDNSVQLSRFLNQLKHNPCLSVSEIFVYFKLI